MTPAPRWSDIAIRRLSDTESCPACGAATLADHSCATCGADYSAIGAELWAASSAAVAALRTRQEVLDRVPRFPARAPEPAPFAAFAPPTASPAAEPSRSTPALVDDVVAATDDRRFPPPRDLSASPVPGDPPQSATVQSVLAVAGAGLVAIAAVVFTFFNPDLTDRILRTVIVAAIALLFLGGAWWLARRRLQFSAEAVGALGMVFLALVVGSTADGTRAGVWLTAAFGTVLVGTVMATLGVLARIRTWLWMSVLGLAFVPLLFGLAAGGQGAVTVGALAGGFTAFALITVLPKTADRFDGALLSERVALTTAEVALVGIALGSSVVTPTAGPAWWLGHSVVLGIVTVLAVLSSRHPAGGLWSFGAGVAGTTAFVVLPGAAGASFASVWYLAIAPAAAAVGVVLVAGLLRMPASVQRTLLLTGALVVLGAVIQPTLFLGAVTAAVTVFDGAVPGDGLVSADTVTATALGLAAAAAGLAATGALAARRTRAARFALSESAEADLGPATAPDAPEEGRRPSGTRWLFTAAAWLAAAAGLVALTTPALSLLGQVGAALASAAVVSVALATVQPLRRARLALRLPAVVAAHAAVLLGGILSVRDDAIVVPAGIGVVAGILVLAVPVPRRARFAHVGVAYAYALFVFGRGLDLAGVAPLPLLCLVTTAGGLVAITATFLRAVRPREWWAILAVTAVPFVAGVAQVMFERSAWTALSTGVIFALALTLTLTRRPGLGRPLRAIAGGLLVPSLAVVAVCLGAQLVPTSGSPVVLPVIAVLVAVVLPARLVLRRGLAARIGTRDAVASALAIEAASLLTGAIAVGLALVRDSAGLGTTLIVLLVLAVGSAATARWAGRRYGWWLSAAAATGALWCAWGLAGVTLVEPYVLPPALGAALVGAVLVARGSRALGLYASGLGLAVLPILVLLAVSGTPGGDAWRAYGLVTAAGVLVVAGVAFARTRRVRSLAPVTLAAAVVAGAAGAVQGVRWGLGLDVVGSATPLVVLALGVGVAGALPAAVAGRWLRTAVRQAAARRWLCAPAVLYAAASAWTTIEREWFTIWTMWGLMLALLIGMLALAVVGRGRRTALPPVWFVFALAFVTGVVAWSPRDLRVEWFSLPLGLLLVAAGAVALRGQGGAASRTLDDWPFGWTGSWALLAPGIVVTLSASMASTITDPLTWRAILVIVLALAAIVVGAARRLAAPFLLGIIALPVENVLAFVVQIGRGIESMPWWITLSVVGAVLLTIAVTYERRSGTEAGLAARLRDLR